MNCATAFRVHGDVSFDITVTDPTDPDLVREIEVTVEGDYEPGHPGGMEEPPEGPQVEIDFVIGPTGIMRLADLCDWDRIRIRERAMEVACDCGR